MMVEVHVASEFILCFVFGAWLQMKQREYAEKHAKGAGTLGINKAVMLISSMIDAYWVLARCCLTGPAAHINASTCGGNV